MTTNALATRQELLPSQQSWQTMLSMAEEFIKSGLLPSAIKTPASAVAIMQTGQELGIPPMYALRNISVINGRPVVGAEVMLAMIYRDHGDGAILFDETTNESCRLRYKRRNWSDYQAFAWTIEDAKAAGLLSKEVWRHYPPAMLRARCISAVARMAFPDTLGGLYAPEELGAEVEVVEGEVRVVEQVRAPVSIVQAEAEPSHEETADETRSAAEARYRTLAKEAVLLEHPRAERIAGVDASTLTMSVLSKSIAALETWIADRKALDQDDAF